MAAEHACSTFWMRRALTGDVCATPSVTSILQVKLSASLKNFIAGCTRSYGKVKLVLKHNRFWVETADVKVCCRGMAGFNTPLDCLLQEYMVNVTAEMSDAAPA